MNFWDRVGAEVDRQKTTYRWIAKKLEKPETTVSGWRSQNILPRAEDAVLIARALGTTVEYLVEGEGEPGAHVLVRDAHGCEVDLDGEAVLVPILSQKVAAGRGQEVLDSEDIVGQLPFLKRMLRGSEPVLARALEVRGDSMTGIHLFDGDMVVFVPGSIRGDGIYVLKVNDTLLVKRVEFDEISRKLRIMSENPRYPEKVESADGQTVTVVGKVYGWVHSHPY